MSNYILWLSIFIASIFIIMVFYMQRNKRKRNLKITYYYSHGCHHCRHFMPVWNDFIDSDTTKGATCEKVDCSENPERCSDITGVPHIVFSDDKHSSVYRGKRDPENLSMFLEDFQLQKF